MKKSNILLFVLLATVMLSSQAYSQTKQEKKMKTKYMEAGMYNSSESKEAVAFFEKGTVSGNNGDYKAAVKWYKKAIEEDPNFVEAYDNLGAAYRKMGDLENAKKNYNKSIELYPQGNMAHQNLGLVYWIEKDYTKALEQYSIMQKNDSTDAEGYYGTIQIFFALKDYKSAVKNASKTLEIYEATNSPYLGDAQFLLGLSYYYDNDNKNAKIYLEQAKKSGAQIPAAIQTNLGMK